MTLLEIMVALVVLTISVQLLSSTVTAAIAHWQAKEERATAVEAGMNQLERMHAVPFELLYATYNDDPDDDPDGPGTAPGRHFAVPDLSPQEGDEDGWVGEVVLPGTAATLLENAANAELCLPRDLNGDLRIDGLDHAADYVVLPVVVRLSWKGHTGDRSFEIATMLAKLEKFEL